MKDGLRTEFHVLYHTIGRPRSVDTQSNRHHNPQPQQILESRLHGVCLSQIQGPQASDKTIVRQQLDMCISLRAVDSTATCRTQVQNAKPRGKRVGRVSYGEHTVYSMPFLSHHHDCHTSNQSIPPTMDREIAYRRVCRPISSHQLKIIGPFK